jgi:hypothetical protein
MPLAFVYNDAPDRSRFHLDSSDKGFNYGFELAGTEKPEDRRLHDIDAGKETLLNSRVPQGVPKIADLAALINADVKKRTAASQDKGRLRSFLLMGLQESTQGEVRDHIPVVAEDGFVSVQEVLNIFESACRVQQHGFMTEEDGYVPPAPIRKFFRVGFRTVMGIHDETIDANAQEMIHHAGDDGTSSDLQQRLGASLRQRPKPRPQSRAQNKSCLEPSSFQRHLTGIMESWVETIKK